MARFHNANIALWQGRALLFPKEDKSLDSASARGRWQIAERVCGALVLVAPIASGALFLGAVGYAVWCAMHGLPNGEVDNLLCIGGSTATLGGFAYFRRHAKDGRAHLVLAGAIALNILASRMWLAGPMHDIAMVFGSHGRFGDVTVDARGAPTYFVRDDTLPWLVFAPPILATFGHWLARRILDR